MWSIGCGPIGCGLTQDLADHETNDQQQQLKKNNRSTHCCFLHTSMQKPTIVLQRNWYNHCCAVIRQLSIYMYCTWYLSDLKSKKRQKINHLCPSAASGHCAHSFRLSGTEHCNKQKERNHDGGQQQQRQRNCHREWQRGFHPVDTAVGRRW